MARFTDWLEHRLGYRKPLSHLLDEPIPGGASFRYVFGSALLFTFGVQVVTGILLAFVYAPTTTAAWASVHYIQEQMALGWFLRGLHYFGAMAMMVLLVVHLLQTFSAGAHRKPRELNWIVGVFMAVLVGAFAATGYGLPWDQRAFVHVRIATGLAGAVLEPAGDLLRGGNDVGQLTITRFYAIHVFVLPIFLAALIAVHLWLFRRHGVTYPRTLSPEEALRRAQAFFPAQALRDGLFSLGVFAAIVGLTVWQKGAPLGVPADPSLPSEASRPEWYFLWFFHLLRYLPGSFEPIATLVLPVGSILFLCALPFIDRGPPTKLAAKLWGAAVFGAVAAGVALTALAFVEDNQNAVFRKQLARTTKEAERARVLAKEGIPPEGPAVMMQRERARVKALALAKKDGDQDRSRLADGGVASGMNAHSAAVPAPPGDPGTALFLRKCGGCHPYAGHVKERKGPDLTGWGSRAWLTAFLQNPKSPDKYGYEESKFVQKGGMKAIDDPEEVKVYVEWILAQAGAPHDRKLAAKGRAAFDDNGCDQCHGFGAQAKGPDLLGWWSRAWLEKLLRDPADKHLYGARNQMKIPKSLTDADRKVLIEWLLALRDEPPAK